MHRRQFLSLTAALATAITINPEDTTTARDLYATIAAGDEQPLTKVQTSHTIDHTIRKFAVRDPKSIGRLLSWLDNGSNPVLRVNAAGILAKTGSPELADQVALALNRDTQMRHLYLAAVQQRVGTSRHAIAAELTNPSDHGARWCAAWLLPTDARPALTQAMRTEQSKEVLRAMGLATIGALHDVHG